MKHISLAAALLVCTVAQAAQPPLPGAHAHYAVLTADWDGPAPFASVDVVYGPRESIRGQEYLWWQLQVRKENDPKSAPLMTLRTLSSRDPLADSPEPMKVERYILRIPATGETLEYRDIHTTSALLPA